MTSFRSPWDYDPNSVKKHDGVINLKLEEKTFEKMWRRHHNTGLIQDIQQYCSDRGMLYPYTYIPYFASSIGSHIANLRNKKFNSENYDDIDPPYNNSKIFYTEAESIRDLRFNLLFVAPAGYMKSYHLEVFLNPEVGLLTGAGIPLKQVINATEAGLVGTGALAKNGRKIKIRGMAEKYPHAIIGSEECSGLFNATNGYNASMENTLLMLFDSGRVYKTTTSVELDYQSYVTFWGATQPARISLKSGMARRFGMLFYTPSTTDMQMFKDWKERFRRKKPQWTVIHKIRKKINALYHGFKANYVEWDKKYLEFCKKLDVCHFELDIIDKFAIGFNVMDNYELNEGELYVQLTPQLERLIRNLMWYREIITTNPIGYCMSKLMMSRAYAYPDELQWWRKNELKRECRKISMGYDTTEMEIQKAMRDGMITSKPYKPETGRPTTIYKVCEGMRCFIGKEPM